MDKDRAFALSMVWRSNVTKKLVSAYWQVPVNPLTREVDWYKFCTDDILISNLICTWQE